MEKTDDGTLLAATPRDAATVAGLLDAFNREFDTPTPGAAVLAARLEGLLAGGDVVALLAGEPAVGVALLTLRPNVWYSGPVALLDELYVVPEMRGRGIGSALLAAAEAVARERGGDVVEINVDGGDTDARRFYERHGYANSEPGDDQPLLYYYRELARPKAEIRRDVEACRSATELAGAAHPVVIRRADSADRDGIVSLAGVRDAGNRLGALMADSSRCILVAEAGSGLIGLAEAQFYGPALRRAFGVVRLHDLVVKDDFRRRGIGSALLDEIERWAMSIPQCRYVEWQSSRSAIPFYEARGLTANEYEDSADYPYFVVDIGHRRGAGDASQESI